MRHLKLLLIALLVTVSLVGFTVSAQDADAQTFTLLAGASGGAQVDVLAFAPQNLQIHRGDTVIWYFLGFHSVRFDSEWAELQIMPEGGGAPVLNPEIAFPSIESGGTYTGGVVGSGLPFESNMFKLTFDVEPGTYQYVCDIHPGMTGTITVVADDVEIPSPVDAFGAGIQEIGGNLAAGGAAGMEAMGEYAGGMFGAMAGEDGAQITAGAQSGPAAVLAFFPSVTVIKAGQSVTWTIDPEGSEPHTVTSFPLPSEEEQFVFVPPAAEGELPSLEFTSVWAPSVEDGAVIGGEDSPFNSGIVFPGGTITLTFSEPGVYNYGCFLHPGMYGVVVVEPAAA